MYQRAPEHVIEQSAESPSSALVGLLPLFNYDVLQQEKVT